MDSVAIPCTGNLSIKHCICPGTVLKQRNELRLQQQIPKCWIMFISSQASFYLFQARLSGQLVTFPSMSTQLQRFHLPLKYHFYNAIFLYMIISIAQITKNYLKNGCLITSEQAVFFWKRNYLKDQHLILLDFQYVYETAQYPGLGFQEEYLPSPSFPMLQMGQMPDIIQLYTNQFQQELKC